MDVNSNVNGLHSEPGFHPEARYEFKVHVGGADFETLTYRVSFGAADSDGRQPLRLHALTGQEAREDAAPGELVLEGRTGQTASAGGARLWAGRTGDSFYIDLSLLALINGAVAGGTAPDLAVLVSACANRPAAAMFRDSPVASGKNETTTPAATVAAAKIRAGRRSQAWRRPASSPVGRS